MPWQTQSIRSGFWRARIPWGWRRTCALSAPREAWALGGGWGPKYPSVQKKKNGNAVFVTAQAPKKPMGAGKITKYMPSECPALETERESENPASSDPQSGRPF